MRTSLAHRRRRLGALIAGLCLAAGSVGGAALADTSASASVEAGFLVQAGMNPINARQVAARLNQAIDSAAQTMAQAAAGAVRSTRLVQTTATATKAFANEVDAALTQFAKQSIAGLKAAGAGTDAMATGTLAALGAVVKTIPGAVSVTTGAAVNVASGANGTSVSASLNPQIDTALRKTISDSVKALRPVLPLTRATLRTVGAGVRQVVDASVVAVHRTLRATVDFTCAMVDMAPNAVPAARTVVNGALAATKSIVTAVDATLDNLSSVNISAEVDASLHVSVS